MYTWYIPGRGPKVKFTFKGERKYSHFGKIKKSGDLFDRVPLPFGPSPFPHTFSSTLFVFFTRHRQPSRPREEIIFACHSAALLAVYPSRRLEQLKS